MSTTEDEILLLNRYKVLEGLHKREPERHYYSSIQCHAVVLKCYDKWTDKVVALHLFEGLVHHSWNHGIQQCRALMIADVLQRMSDNFLKINEIYYRSQSYEGKYYSYTVNREFMDCTLAQAFKTKNISHHEKARIFYKLCKIVSELEDAGIVHTNLNPDHILLSDDLQTVKVCGFLAGAGLASEDITKKIIDSSEEHRFQAIELSVASSYPLASSMDVWSLGTLLAYMLLNGEPLFIHNGFNLSGEVFGFLGDPTPQEANEGLRMTHYPYFNAARKAEKNFRNKFGRNENNAIWIPVLDAIFWHHPKNRITVKKLLKITEDTNRFLMCDSNLIGPTARMEQFKISINPFEMKAKELNNYLNEIFSMRQDEANETRKDLLVLAFNLGSATPVPAEVWVNIFIMAKTNPLMYKIRSA